MTSVCKIDKNWTLFLDRDGVINEKRDNDYVKKWQEFSFIKGSLEAISKLSIIFGRIIVVTNQRGVGRGLMTEEDLLFIHKKMTEVVYMNGGKIDQIYYCTDTSDYSENRKPNIGMALKAKLNFPDIDFTKSVMVGDSITDMQFGNKLGMNCILIDNRHGLNMIQDHVSRFESLSEYALFLL
jgi:histidinol-phosphate phosphatase family protein